MDLKIPERRDTTEISENAFKWQRKHLISVHLNSGRWKILKRGGFYMHWCLFCLCFSHLYLHHPSLKLSHWPPCVPYFRIKDAFTHQHKSQPDTHMHHCRSLSLSFLFPRGQTHSELNSEGMRHTGQTQWGSFISGYIFFFLSRITSCGISTRRWRALWRKQTPKKHRLQYLFVGILVLTISFSKLLIVLPPHKEQKQEC